MREDNLAKIMAEPKLVTVSGQPRFLPRGRIVLYRPHGQSGGPPRSKSPYGTQIDFVPIVLGNGQIRLDVRSRISEPDRSQQCTIHPALYGSQSETSLELQAGQTMAIAGLVQTRIERRNGGLPWISEVPYLGAAFRRSTRTRTRSNCSILVTPELAEAARRLRGAALRAGHGRPQAPAIGNCIMKGHIEVPKCPDPAPQGSCGKCDGSGNGGNPKARRPTA